MCGEGGIGRVAHGGAGAGAVVEGAREAGEGAGACGALQREQGGSLAADEGVLQLVDGRVGAGDQAGGRAGEALGEAGVRREDVVLAGRAGGAGGRCRITATR
ncbi:MAG: hypothetical protein JNL82_32840 [Myxococcales bacterium]|nr:hypothetical protein [Myxococcales bacterium]